MKNKAIIINLVVALVIGAAAFYGGMQYQKSQKTEFQFASGQVRQFGRGQGATATSGNRMMIGGGTGMRPVMGEIISQDETSITVKSQDGSSKIVLFSDKTSINKASTGTTADLKIGETVAAFGKENSDGSITAQNIQLNPQMRVFGKPSAEPTK